VLDEIGANLAVVEALAQAAEGRDRTSMFAWYNLAGSFATALGSLAGGWVSAAAGYRAPIAGYAILGLALAAVFAFLSPRIERAAPPAAPSALRTPSSSRGVIARLSALFALDSFAGGLVVQSIMAYWFYRRFGLSPAALGTIFFGANLFAGVSALGAAAIAKRIGLLNTMVFTHLPSNVLLILVPFMPNLPLAITVLLLRFSISQMDVPTRQAFVIAAVDPAERTAAAGITGVARTTGAALAPVIAMPLIAGMTHDALPFVAAGALKIVYDLLLLRSARRIELTR